MHTTKTAKWIGKQVQKQTLNIVIANLLWALLPIAVVQLFQTYSVFLIFLLRFFFGGIFILLTAFVLIIANRKKHPEVNFNTIWRYLKSQNPDYRQLHQIGYFTLVGSIGFTIHIVFFFFSFKLLGVVVTMVGFPVSLILVTVFSKEATDFLKGVYLGVLIVAVLIMGIGRIESLGNSVLNPLGWLSLLLFIVAISFMMNHMAKDPLNAWETSLLIKSGNFYRIIRMLVKIGGIFIIASAFVFPIAGAFLVLPADTVFQQEAVKFFQQLPLLGELLITWQGLFLIFGTTVTCYLLLFGAEAYWPRGSLPFDTWASILSIIEPTGSVLFGVLLLNEQFPPFYLFIVVFLLGLSILLRYVHETSSKVIAYVALKLVPQREKAVFEHLYQVKAIQSISSVVGDYDLILFIQASNISAFNRIIRKKLMMHPDIEEVKEFLVEEVIK